MCLLWFLICFLLFGPFVRIRVAIGCMVVLYFCRIFIN
jgi:hypothetical protein